MVEDGGGAFACEVEVAVLAEVDGGGLVGNGGVVHAECVVSAQRVNDLNEEIPWESFLPVRAFEGEGEADVVWGDLGVPEHFVDADVAAVEGAWDAARGVVGG